jgi:sec-independent protein translocase protein TatC
VSALQTDEDDIEASRMPLLDHLTELRTRLLITVAALLVGFGASFAFADQIFLFLVEPFKRALCEIHSSQCGSTLKLYFTHGFGFFFVKLQVALFAGVILAFPVIAWQLYAFIAPGLYRRERNAAAPFMIAAPLMFLAGAAFVFYVAMPFALEFALRQQVTQGAVQVEFLPKVDEYLGLVTTLVLAFGLCFQMPVVLSLLARVGMVNASLLRKGRRYAIMGIAVVAACVTPPDILSMTFMAVPLYILYELSIWLVWLIEKARMKAETAEAAALAE